MCPNIKVIIAWSEYSVKMIKTTYGLEMYC